MQFLKTVFWALLAAILALFGWVNWTPVTINLWANLQADIKLPILLLVFFLLGWLPTWLIMRARLWSFRRRVEALERNQPAPVEPEANAEEQEIPAA
jgi:putative membrane protein